MQMGMQVTLITSRPLIQDAKIAVGQAAVQGAIVEMAREAGLCIRSVIDAYQGVHTVAVRGPQEKIMPVLRNAYGADVGLGLSISVQGKATA